MNKTIITLGLALLICGCSSDNEEIVVPVTPEEETVIPIDINVQQTPGRIELTDQQKDMVTRGGFFAFNLMKQINAESKESFIMSPMSAAFLLGMMNDGAAGITRQEISQVLGFEGIAPITIDEHFANIMVNAPQLDTAVTIEIANCQFINQKQNYRFLKDYANRMMGYYQAPTEALDFSNQELALKRINGWCSEKTHGMIPKILNDIDNSFVDVQLNAIYFEGKWSHPFMKEDTKEKDFNREDGTKPKVKMMHQVESIAYMEDDKIQAVSLPYGNKKYQMVVLLPSATQHVDDLVNNLDVQRWEQINNALSMQPVILSLPRFDTKTETELNGILQRMGMPSAFYYYSANFDNMILPPKDGNYYVNRIRQLAKIEMSEEGTKAAVVTGKDGRDTGDGSGHTIKYKVFNADHPFIYLITEKTTGAIFFMGKYTGVE